MRTRLARIALSLGAATCFSLAAVSCSSGPAVHCADWDTHHSHHMVHPKPVKEHKRVYDSFKRKYVWKWVDGKTPAPHMTTTTTRTCDEWVTESPDN